MGRRGLGGGVKQRKEACGGSRLAAPLLPHAAPCAGCAAPDSCAAIQAPPCCVPAGCGTPGRGLRRCDALEELPGGAGARRRRVHAPRRPASGAARPSSVAAARQARVAGPLVLPSHCPCSLRCRSAALTLARNAVQVERCGRQVGAGPRRHWVLGAGEMWPGAGGTAACTNMHGKAEGWSHNKPTETTALMTSSRVGARRTWRAAIMPAVKSFSSRAAKTSPSQLLCVTPLDVHDRERAYGVHMTDDDRLVCWRRGQTLG